MKRTYRSNKKHAFKCSTICQRASGNIILSAT